MTSKYDNAAATEIIASFGSRAEMLVQILAAFVDRFSYLSDQAIRQIADELNLSRAEVWGAINFYHDFRIEPPGNTVIKVCQAESCQAMGSRQLTAHAEKTLGIKLNSKSDDGKHSLEPVYCLGNCACSPSVMIDDRVYGRVDSERFDALVRTAGSK